MFGFGRQETQAPVEVEMSLQDRVEAAAQDVIAADARFTQASEKLREYTREHRITLDGFKQISRCGLRDGAPHDLAFEVQALVSAEYNAHRDFSAALSIHAGLKLAASQEINS